MQTSRKMTRFELEKWCEEFLKEIFDNTNQFMPVFQKLINGDIEEEDFTKELMALTQNANTYESYRKRLADFIEDFATAPPKQEVDKKGKDNE